MKNLLKIRDFIGLSIFRQEKRQFLLRNMKFKSVKLKIFSLICDRFVRFENQEKKLTFIQFDRF
jgi:hypothetical protein